MKCLRDNPKWVLLCNATAPTSHATIAWNARVVELLESTKQLQSIRVWQKLQCKSVESVKKSFLLLLQRNQSELASTVEKCEFCEWNVNFFSSLPTFRFAEIEFRNFESDSITIISHNMLKASMKYMEVIELQFALFSLVSLCSQLMSSRDLKNFYPLVVGAESTSPSALQRIIVV